MLPHHVAENFADKCESSSLTVMANSTPRASRADGLELTKTTKRQVTATDARPWSSCSVGVSGLIRRPVDGVAEIGSGLDRPDSMLSCVSSELDSGFDDLRSFIVTPTALPVTSQAEIDVNDGGGRINEDQHPNDVELPSTAAQCHDDDVDELSDGENAKDPRDQSLNSDLYRSQDLTGMTDGSDLLSSSSDGDENAAAASNADIEVSSLSKMPTMLPEVIQSGTALVSTTNDAASCGTASCASSHDAIEQLLVIDEVGASDSDENGNGCCGTGDTCDVAKSTNDMETRASCSCSCSSFVDAVGDGDSCFDLFQISDLSPQSMSKYAAEVVRSSSSMTRFSDVSASSLLTASSRNGNTSATSREVEALLPATVQTPSSDQHRDASSSASLSSRRAEVSMQQRCYDNRLLAPAANGDAEVVDSAAREQSSEQPPVNSQVEEREVEASHDVDSSITKLGTTIDFNDTHLQSIPFQVQPQSDAAENSGGRRNITTTPLNEESSCSMSNVDRSEEKPEPSEKINPVEQKLSADVTRHENVSDSSCAVVREGKVGQEIQSVRRRRRKQSVTHKRPRTHSPHPNVIHSSRAFSIAAAAADEEIDVNVNDVTSMTTEPDFDNSEPSAADANVKKDEDTILQVGLGSGDVPSDMMSEAHPPVWQPWYESRVPSDGLTFAKVNDCQSSPVKGPRPAASNDDRELPTEFCVVKTLSNKSSSSNAKTVDVAVQVNASTDVERFSAPSRSEVCDLRTKLISSTLGVQSCCSTAECEQIVAKRLLESLPTYGVNLGFAAAETFDRFPSVNEAAVQTSSSHIMSVDIKNNGDGKRRATAVRHSIVRTASDDRTSSTVATATKKDFRQADPSRCESTTTELNQQTTTETQYGNVQSRPIFSLHSCQQSVVYPIGDSHTTSLNSTTVPSYCQLFELSRPTTAAIESSTALGTRQRQSPVKLQTVGGFHHLVPWQQQDQVADGMLKASPLILQPIDNINRLPQGDSANLWSPRPSVLQRLTPRNIFIVDNLSVPRTDSWRMPTIPCELHISRLPAMSSTIRGDHQRTCGSQVPGNFQLPVMNAQRPSTPFPQQTYIRYHPYAQQPQLHHGFCGPLLRSSVPHTLPEVVDRKEDTPQQNMLPNVRGIGTEAAEMLLNWINSNPSKSLYPTADEKRLLAERTGISTYQVNRWFDCYRTKLRRRERKEAGYNLQVLTD